MLPNTCAVYALVSVMKGDNMIKKFSKFKIITVFTIVLLMIADLLAPSTAITAKAAPKYALNYNSITVATGTRQRLKLRSVNYKKVKWSSKNSNIAKVDSKGYVTGVSKGNTYIKAKYKGKTYTCKVKVVKNYFYRKNFKPLYQDYSESGTIYIPLKAYYSGNKLCIDTYIYNHSTSPVVLSGGVLITVYNKLPGDPVIGEQSFSDLSTWQLTIDPYDYDLHTFVIDASKVKNKRADLTTLTPGSFVYLTY